MRERQYDDDDDGSFSQTGSEGPPDLVDSSPGDDIEDHQYRQDFIRESAELFESEGDKKSNQRLADFTKSELLQRLMQLEKEEQAQKYHESRPGSVRSFQREFDKDKVVRDMLRDQSTSRKRSFRAAMSPPQRKPLQNDASASDSDRESTATDSTRSTTRLRNNFPWVSVVRYSHKDHTQPAIASLLVEEADRIMHVAGDYIVKRPLDINLGPFKRSHNVSSAYCFPIIVFSKLFRSIFKKT
jgi:hypothetical protein